MRIRARSGRWRPRPVRGVSHGVRDCTLSCAVVVTVLCITSPVAAAFGWSTQTLPTSFGSPGGKCRVARHLHASRWVASPARLGKGSPWPLAGMEGDGFASKPPILPVARARSKACPARRGRPAWPSGLVTARRPLSPWPNVGMAANGRYNGFTTASARARGSTPSCSSASACTAVGSTGQRGGPVGRASAALGREILVCAVGPYSGRGHGHLLSRRLVRHIDILHCCRPERLRSPGPGHQAARGAVGRQAVGDRPRAPVGEQQLQPTRERVVHILNRLYGRWEWPSWAPC